MDSTHWPTVGMFHATHLSFMNSFGVDTWKVIMSSVADETQILRIVEVFGLWDKRD